MSILGDFSTVIPFNLFKTDEQKKKEYEDNIAANVAAMEVQNRANESTAYSNDPRFQRPPGPAAVDPLRGKKLNDDTLVQQGIGGKFYTADAPYFFSANPAQQRRFGSYDEEMKNKIRNDIADYNANEIQRQAVFGGSLTNMGYFPEPTNTISSVKAEPFSIAQQAKLRNLENTTPAGNISLSALQRGVGFNAASQPQTTKVLNKATGGMDFMSLLKILGMVNSGSQTQSNVTPGITPGITPAVAGTKIQDEDLYARYRR